MLFGSKNKIGAQVDGIGARTDGLGPHVEGAAPYLDGVGASSASDHWSSAIPRIDLSEIKSLKPEERESLTKQMEDMRKSFCDALSSISSDTQAIRQDNQDTRSATERENWISRGLAVVGIIIGIASWFI